MLANNDLDRVIRAIPWNGITVNGPTCNEPKSFCRFIATTVRRFLGEEGGKKIYIYIDLLSCALFFKRFPRRIGQLIIRRRQYGEFLLGSRNILGWKLLTLTVEGWRLRWRVWREMNLEWTKFVGGEREKKKLRSNKVIFFEERALISKSESSWTEIEVATRGERESERGRGNRKKLAQWVAWL